MDRYVFCPNESAMDEAIRMAKEWSLPILNGDSERSLVVEFDRNVVSVILVPIFNGFDECPQIIEPNMAYVFRYQNDFIECGVAFCGNAASAPHSATAASSRLTDFFGMFALPVRPPKASQSGQIGRAHV